MTEGSGKGRPDESLPKGEPYGALGVRKPKQSENRRVTALIDDAKEGKEGENWSSSKKRNKEQFV